jgi:hypothetical protein
MPAPPTNGPCTECAEPETLTHSTREHEVAAAWLDPLLQWVSDDTFVRTDSPMSYSEARTRFRLDTTDRRLGRVLDGVEQILRERGWPDAARAGISAYVVNASSREPSAAWMSTWQMDPKAARAQARQYVRELALAD